MLPTPKCSPTPNAPRPARLAAVSSNARLIYRNYFHTMQEVTTKQRFRNNKYRLEVRERDHLPMHVHLVGGGFDVLIDLATLQSSGAWPRGLQIEVMAWINANLDELVKDWKKWHP